MHQLDVLTTPSHIKMSPSDFAKYLDGSSYSANILWREYRVFLDEDVLYNIGTIRKPS